MTRLKQSLLALIVALAVFYNVGRLDWGDGGRLDISTAVYVVGFLAVVAAIFLAPLRRMHRYILLSFWGGFYLAVRLITLPFVSRPLLGGIDTYVTITELAFLLVLVMLAHNVGCNLDDFETAVSNLTLAGVARRVQPLAEAQEDIQKEMIRSRRTRSPLSVIVMAPDPQSLEVTLNQAVYDIQCQMAARYVNANLLRIAARVARRTDMIVRRSEETYFVVVSPDTDTASADSLAQRIQATAEKEVGVQMRYGVATFPDEDVPFEELLDHARHKVGRPAVVRSAGAPLISPRNVGADMPEAETDVSPPAGMAQSNGLADGI